jgi:hypothetical protein
LSGGIVAAIAIISVVIIVATAVAGRKAWQELQKRRGMMNESHANPLYTIDNREKFNAIFEEKRDVLDPNSVDMEMVAQPVQQNAINL